MSDAVELAFDGAFARAELGGDLRRRLIIVVFAVEQDAFAFFECFQGGEQGLLPLLPERFLLRRGARIAFVLGKLVRLPAFFRPCAA